MYLHRLLGRPNQTRKLIQYTCQQDWDSSLVKTFKLKKREKRVCMVLFTFGFVCVCLFLLSSNKRVSSGNVADVLHS